MGFISPVVSGLYILKNIYTVFTDKRRAYFKGRYPGTSANLKKCVDWEKDRMEKFLRLRSFILFKKTLLQCLIDEYSHVMCGII